MPSTNKLPNSDLNQWVASDRPVMEDFNRDNEIIDGLVGHLKKTPYVGTDGYWYVWDTDVAEYVKSETKARGEIGPQGLKGEQGPQGPKGDTGEKGDTGAGFRVLGLFESAAALTEAHPSGAAATPMRLGPRRTTASISGLTKTCGRTSAYCRVRRACRANAVHRESKARRVKKATLL